MPIDITSFLQAQGFGEHPFATLNAEREREHLSSFFVRSASFYWLIGNPSKPESLILFAPRGFGKTSQRIELDRQLRQRPADPALVITLDDFGTLLTSSNASVTLGAYIDWIRSTTLETLADVLTRNPLRHERFRLFPGAQARLHALLTRFVPWCADSNAPPPDPRILLRFAQPAFGPKSWLLSLSELAKAAGFASVYCLLDGFDELAETSNSAEAQFSLLRPLLDAPGLIDECGFAFRFFLPDFVEQPMRAAKVGRLDRIFSRSLTWSNAELAQMLRDRLSSFNRSNSNTTFITIERFRDLCEPRYNVDEDLVQLANGSPRRLIQLARMIFDAHCELANDPIDKISQAAIDMARRAFIATVLEGDVTSAFSTPLAEETAPAVADMPLPSPETEPQSQPALSQAEPVEANTGVPPLFLDQRGDIWLGTRRLETPLGGIARRCLEILWMRRHEMVRYDDLIDLLYRDDLNERGDPRGSLDKLIQRLRLLLEQGSSSSNTYIKTVKGTGYRLENFRESSDALSYS